MADERENKKKLFSYAMGGEWDKVMDMYNKNVTLHKARFSRSGLTALHIAVCNGKEQVVKKMVDAITSHNNKEAFRTPNNRNNTALHLAASMGNVTICRTIASIEPTLVDVRNVDGETPLFLAALHGRKQTFLSLHYIRNPDTNRPSRPSYDNCRRKNGDTFLHCAIKGDYFDLAFQIIHLYEDLGIWKNDEGSSPMHLLASKPCVFKSGSRLGRMETIIYRCINVEKLKPENPPYETTSPNGTKDGDSHDDCPNNYKALWDVFRLIRKGVTTTVGRCKNWTDPEAQVGGLREGRDKENPLFPANYQICCNLFKFFYLLLLLITFGIGYEELRKIYRKKETHTWVVQIVKQILDHDSSHEYEDDGSNPHEGYSPTSQEPTIASQIELPFTNDKKNDKTIKRIAETPILIAAKNGVMEIIENIVESLPVALHDLNEDKKNIVLLAVEHRQPHVYELLLKNHAYKDSLFHQLDKDGNSALHLAATLRDHKPWLIPGEALQMQWEHKWYQLVNDTMPPDFFYRYNNKNETPEVIFTKSHKELANRAAEWLNKTSESCSVVAALIATVAFATAATVPGGVNQDSGHPTLENESEFQLFAISALIALGSSITAVVMFLSILTSRFQEQDFNKTLPRKLLVGLTSLFVSIASMLVSFCAGHFFVLKDTLHYLALPIYVATCLPVTLFVLAQFPLYFDLIWATFKHVPQRSHRPTAR